MKIGKGEKAIAIMAVLALAIAAVPAVAIAELDSAMGDVIDLMWLFIPLIFVFSLLGGLMGMMGGAFAMKKR